MRVLVALSGGVDSSVAAAMLVADGHDVVGATMKLWGGASDSGCCSVADVEDARRVAQQLGITHHVFNFSDDFDRHVVDPYVSDHAAGRTPNPCVACNRHLKFDRFVGRARQLGFDAVATGHHARVVATSGEAGTGPDGTAGPFELRRGRDAQKDQSYVLHMLGQHQLARLLLPIGELTKAEVRSTAADLGLRTAAKPDSQDVCFISKTGGREVFLGARIGLHPGRMIDRAGRTVGSVPAVELVTVGQRRHLGVTGGPTVKAERRYALDVDVAAATVTVGSFDELQIDRVPVHDVTWIDAPLAPDESTEVQTSAHGATVAATWDGRRTLVLASPVRRIAPGQSVVFYSGDRVLGGGLAS